MNRKTTKKVDESTLTTLCAVCRGAFLDAKGVRLRRADPRQLVKDVCTYCQTRYGQNTVEARRTCNGSKDVTIRCKVFYGLTKEDEATLFAIQTGNATCLTAGERLRANLVAENPDALYFVGITSNAGVEFAYDGIRAPWKIYCIETEYELYKQYGCERYVEMLHIINEAWKGNVDSNPAFEEPSMILLEQIFTIDKSRIERFMGYASKAEMLRIDMALLVSLALNVLSGNRSE